MTTNEFAKKIAEFIKHNNIDVSKHSMEEIVAGYMEAQSKMYKEIEKELISSMS
jgi:hypothetical protein